MVLGNSSLVWGGGKLTNPRNRSRLWARPKMEGTQKAKKLSQSPVKGWVKVTQKQKWFDLTAAGAPPEKIEATQHCLVSLWKALKREQFRSASPAPAIPDALPAPAEASGIHALDT